MKWSWYIFLPSHTVIENTEAKLNDTTRDRDELKEKLNVCGDYSRQGWVHFGGSLYYISSEQKSWQDSRSDCQQRGADLVVINSREEQEFTRQFQKVTWIGLTDRETEGKWMWVDGTPLTMSFWGNGEPNSHDGNDEDCGEMKFLDNENSWNDKPCDIETVWICEKLLSVA
ncbi:CD209 antigen-like protein E isoform X2 [Mugil cephalus]|uniref:CD209 antigen-like protein E isoform X2 n=1 Tax=Mugil cephalus TaxID=48193 RepID=UPI001FB72D7D|nr:CD209 antigen-like protein E isoform X2 [Mugil cephalus]